MTLVVGIISLIAAVANSWHVIVAWLHQPPNTVFTGIAHYFADYFLYVSQMREGTLFTSHWFTNESLAPTWIYWFNGLLGRIGDIAGFSPFATYNLALPALVFALCILWWKLIQKIFADNFTRIIAFVFVLTASNVPGLGDFWFSPMPALNRLGGVPHQIFQTILLVGVMLTLSRPFLLLPLAFLAATTNPIQMLLLTAAVAIAAPRRLPFLAIPALAGALLVNEEFARQPVLMAAKTWEAAQLLDVGVLQFLLAVGPIVVLLPFGIKHFLKKSDPLRRLILVYGVLSVVLFFSPIPRLLGTSPVRWLSPAAYTLLPILAAATLQKSRYRYLLLALYAVGTVPALFLQVQGRMTDQKFNYIPTAVIQGLSKLQSQPEGVILVNPAIPYDVLIPVFTGHPSFTGHPIHTLYPDVKERLRQNYFSGRMTDAQAKQFLIDHRIVYVITELP